MHRVWIWSDAKGNHNSKDGKFYIGFPVIASHNRYFTGNSSTIVAGFGGGAHGGRHFQSQQISEPQDRRFVRQHHPGPRNTRQSSETIKSQKSSMDSNTKKKVKCEIKDETADQFAPLAMWREPSKPPKKKQKTHSKPARNITK